MDIHLYRQIGRRIRQARESIGMSQEELAQELGYNSSATISNYEGGGRKISIADLQKISNVLGLPLSHLLEEMPVPETGRIQLRAQRVRPAARASLAAFLTFARKNGSRIASPPVGIFGHGAGEATEQVLELAEVTEPPVELRRVAERLGVPVYDWDFPDEISGVFFSEDDIVAIGINGLHPYVRQRFTTAHELGHFLFNTERDLFVDFANAEAAVLDEDDGQESLERKVNQFAANLLIPREWIEKDVHKYGPDATLLARRYEVSEQALWFRLLALKLVESEGF